ncbi:dermonecrotic toxin domain-containing protein [Pseudomonas tussilaginis]|uniref:dermonecrotic toxin domain-containing protein n=1 Tax=Pseudomonas sp. 5 TaxID=1619949 RepID=UPI0005EB3687|nr:DUF6543 domain-containing protein [Pseudomonas sp. 5]KJK08907.1 hypothetical protein UB47_04210 [Pseudomonas sp. 5]
MTTSVDISLERIAQRYVRQFPDLHGLARQAAGHVLRGHLGYWLDPDSVYWHEFESAATSTLSYTGWCHSQPPHRSMTLTELVIQRFSPAQQTYADELSVYGGFYRVDASQSSYDERNELRLAPQAVLEMFWRLDFAGKYTTLLKTFRTERGDDFCLLARARFLAATASAPLAESERAQVLDATLASTQVPLTLEALQRSRHSVPPSGWGVLTIAGVAARSLFLLTLKTGRYCLYLADERGSVVVLENLQALQAWLQDQVGSKQGCERMMLHFVGGDVLAQALRPRLNKYFKSLVMNADRIRIGSHAIPGDLFEHLRDLVMDELVSNAHERLTSNAELRKAAWLSGLQSAAVIIAPMAPLGWPMALTSLGVGVGTLALHLDRAINGKSAWRAAAWWAVVLDVLFVLLDAALIRTGELFSQSRVPQRVAAQAVTVGDPEWGRYMRPAVDDLLAFSDRALARQESLLVAVPLADEQAVGAAGEYLDAFSEPLAVYRDELGYGSPAIAEYSHSPARYSNLWRGLALEDGLAVCIARSHRLAEALDQIGVHNPLRMYRATSSIRGTGSLAFREGRLGVGDVLVSTEFCSFTDNPYALWEFFNNPQAQVSGREVFDDSAVVYVLEPGEAMQVTPVAPFSTRPDEAESLMMPGRYLQVEQVTAVQGERYRFMEVRLKALSGSPDSGGVHDMRTGEPFDRAALAQQLGGAGDDSLMRRFFPLPT